MCKQTSTDSRNIITPAVGQMKTFCLNKNLYNTNSYKNKKKNFPHKKSFTNYVKTLRFKTERDENKK